MSVFNNKLSILKNKTEPCIINQFHKNKLINNFNNKNNLYNEKMLFYKIYFWCKVK